MIFMNMLNQMKNLNKTKVKILNKVVVNNHWKKLEHKKLNNYKDKNLMIKIH